MAALGWLFIGYLFRPWLPADQIDSYIAGLILLAAAPCTAMVFVWSNLSEGEPDFTLTQVALNDAIMLFAFAPIVGVAARPIGHRGAMADAAAVSRPVHPRARRCWRNSYAAAALAQSREAGARAPAGAPGNRLRSLRLLATLVLLFGFQGEQIIAQPLIIALLAVPILIQVYFNSGLAYLLNRAAGEQHCVAAPRR